MEDNVLSGGFGSSILEYCELMNYSVKVKRFGWPDKFINHGNSVASLRKGHSLDTETIENQICKILDEYSGVVSKSTEAKV